MSLFVNLILESELGFFFHIEGKVNTTAFYQYGLVSKKEFEDFIILFDVCYDFTLMKEKRNNWYFLITHEACENRSACFQTSIRIG